MLRAVLGVALAAALLGAVTPALEDARATRTERLVARELGRVESAAEALAREEAPGARRTLELSLPGESPTTASPTFVALGGLPDDESRDDWQMAVTDTGGDDVLASRVADGSSSVRSVDVDLRIVRDGTPSESDSRALVLRGGGTYHLRFELIRIRGRPVVLVSPRSDRRPLADVFRTGDDSGTPKSNRLRPPSAKPRA